VPESPHDAGKTIPSCFEIALDGFASMVTSTSSVDRSWRNMYGPPPECKKNWVGRKAVCENVSGLLVEIGLPAHDDDPHVPVLNNRPGHERPCYDTGSQARRLTVFSSFLFFCRLLRSEFSKPLRLVGTDNGGVHRAIIVSARQHSPTDPGGSLRKTIPGLSLRACLGALTAYPEEPISTRACRTGRTVVDVDWATA
jgi:hypothetical protein